MNISIKSKYASPPAILNHTSRSAVVFSQNGDLFNELVLLDEIIKIMNTKRINKEVGEDININNLNLNDNQKKCIINIIKYFVFEGSGCKKSISPANSILEIYNIHNINEWKFILCNSDELKNNYINSIYNKLILSIRSKGMPKKISDYCKPWLYNNKNGSLHIRIKK